MKEQTSVKKIALIVGMYSAWFWVPIWVLYYRLFTDYAGVAMLEAISMFSSLALIVPGGLLADMVGRKRLLLMAQSLNVIGAVVIGLSSSFSTLVVGVILLSSAGGLFTSSLEALLFDFLKEQGRETQYKKIWGKMTTVRMLSSAAASLIGGYVYSLHPSFPWFLLAIVSFLSVFVALSLKEPRVETPHDSFGQFIREAGTGIAELFKKRAWMVSIPLLIIGIFFTTDTSGLWDIQAVEYGFSSQTLGLLLTTTYLVLAGVSWFSSKLMGRFSSFGGILLFAVVWAVLWFSSGYAFGILGALLLILRSAVSVPADIQSSALWNGQISSRVRATTLSVITIIRGVPYILVASGIGIVIDTVGIQWLIRMFAVLMLVLLLPTSVWWVSCGRKTKT